MLYLPEVPETVADGVFSIDDGASIWVRRLWDSGEFMASWLSYSAAPSDKTSLLNTLLADSRCKILVVDTSVTINGTVTVPSGKLLRFQNGGGFTGTGTLINPVFEGTLSLSPIGPSIVLTNATWFSEHRLTTDAEANSLGLRQYYNTATNTQRIKNNTTWYDIPTTGTTIYTLTPSTDSSQVVPAGKMIKWITVKNATGLAAFKIGTTVGGSDLAVPQSVTAGVSTTFSILLDSDAGITLYFGGITSATTIKIYTE